MLIFEESSTKEADASVSNSESEGSVGAEGSGAEHR